MKFYLEERHLLLAELLTSNDMMLADTAVCHLPGTL